MSIREQIETLARETFEEIQRTDKALKNAELKKRTASDGVKLARAEADYQEAMKAHHDAKANLPFKVENQMRAIRQRYADELAQRYAVDPAKLDAASLELLKSGIMKPSEYAAMMETARKSGNATMMRMVAKYAADRATEIAAKDGAGSTEARELRMVGHAGNADPAGAALKNFDVVNDVLRRCVTNHAMIGHWDELAGPVLETL